MLSDLVGVIPKNIVFQLLGKLAQRVAWVGQLNADSQLGAFNRHVMLLYKITVLPSAGFDVIRWYIEE